MRAETRRALGAGAEPSSPLVANAHVEVRGEGYELHLVTQFEGQRGERRLDARDCRALVHSVTLTLAVLLGVEAEGGAEPGDGSAAAGAPASTAATSTEPAPTEAAALAEPADADTEATPESSADTAQSTPRPFSLLLGPAFQFGLAPKPALALALGAEVGFSALALGARFDFVFQREDEVAKGITMRTGAFGGALLACGRWTLGMLGLGLCGGAHAATVRGEASGSATRSDSAVAPWYGLSLGGDLSLPHGTRFAARLWAEASASLARPTFVVEGHGEVHRVAPVVGQLGLGMVWSP